MMLIYFGNIYYENIRIKRSDELDEYIYVQFPEAKHLKLF